MQRPPSKRLTMTHASMARGPILAMEGLAGVSERTPAGVRWTVTTTDSARVAELRALGFIGIMALGNHHTSHHVQIARGEGSSAHGH